MTRPECEGYKGRLADICNGTAKLPLWEINKYRVAWGLPPLDLGDLPQVVEAVRARKPMRGLGDAVARLTSAVGIKPCGGCKQRQATLNKIVPFKRNPFHWDGKTPEFVTVERYMRDVRALASKLPPDTSRIIGVARSGLCAATMVSMLLHRPLDILRQSKGDLIDGGNGWRLSGATHSSGPVVLIDDTCMTGNSFKAVTPIARKHFPSLLTAAVYTNPNARQKPDLWARDLPWPHLLEWNLFNSIISPHLALDFDGILCHDCAPGDDDDGPRYARFLADVKPLYLTRRVAVPLIVTARLEKYREQTLDWLARHGVTVQELVMWPGANHRERTPERVAQYKADHFRRFLARRQGLRPALFCESDAWQAKRIAELSGGVTVCPAAGRCYQR